jgi:hypothetical protein
MPGASASGGALDSDRPSEAGSTFVAMSSGRLPTRPFAPEDDWFVEMGGGRSPAAAEETELRERRQPTRDEGEPRLAVRAREDAQRPKLIAGSIVGAVILFVAGALAGAGAWHLVPGAIAWLVGFRRA